MKYIYDIHKIMVDKNLILIYEGEFTQDITKSVLAMAEKNLDSKGEESAIKRKVFNVMVECLQNICKHSDTAASEEEKGAIFMIGIEDNSYVITSGNFIGNQFIPNLREKLEMINSLDKDGLKVLYKDMIQTTTISEKGGAGLGFVDIARKSGQKLEYDFEHVNSNFSFFSFKTKIARIID
jgi:hypothetical protein